jgi:hypothetical protein
MFLVRVVCSDPACLEELEFVVERLEEVDRDVCECGHGFVVVSVGSAQPS